MQGKALWLSNSLSHAKEIFVPRQPGQVGLYSCGPTVYSAAHLGNLRPYVFSDTLRRALEFKGLEVRQVVNITDVGHVVGDGDEGEDKVERAARTSRRTVQQVTSEFESLFHADLASMRVRPAHAYPRASEYVDRMIEFAGVLAGAGHTYDLDAGLYFDVSTYRDYGVLSGYTEARAASARSRMSASGSPLDRTAPEKRHPADFALWRRDLPGDQQRVWRWDSPWGPGVPGWHLECSVMSMALLGERFDLHTGGVDHKTVHHPNEIAQSQTYLAVRHPDDDRPWVPFWLHNEFLLLSGAKISKSAGRVPLLADLTSAGFEPLAFRYLLLGSSYRQQADFTEHLMASAQQSWQRVNERAHLLAGGRDVVGQLDRVRTYDGALAAATSETTRELLREIDAALSDDLNTPRVLATLQKVVRSDGVPAGSDDAVLLLVVLETLLGLGLAIASPAGSDDAGNAAAPELEQQVERLLRDRQKARASRDWPRADAIRDELADLGVVVRDTPAGPVWQPAVRG